MIESAQSLNFKYWPFDLVPNQYGQLVWADRNALRESLDRLGHRLRRHQSVTLHLLWADFGAGKTHTLLFFKQEAAKGKFGEILPIYSALPKGCRTFLDIYRAIVRSIRVADITDAFRKASAQKSRDEFHAALEDLWPSLVHCFHAIAEGSEDQKTLALAWLHAESGLPTKQLQTLSIFGRVKSTDEAVLALIGIVRLFTFAGFKRVVFLVDEFQRVQVLRQQQRDEINAGLHGFFNGCGQGMSLVVSFSFGDEENIKHFLNQELLSRADPLRISIPTLTTDEGIAFLTEVIDLARDTGTPWPVADNVIPKIVSVIQAKVKLTPRRLLKAAGLVFDLASLDMEQGKMTSLSAEYVDEMAAKGDFDGLDDGGDD